MRRAWLLALCVGISAVVTHVLAMRVGHGSLAWWPLAGPFAEPCARIDWSLPRMSAFGAPLLLGMAAHPAWPHPLAGAITILASGWWLLLGLAHTYAGV